MTRVDEYVVLGIEIQRRVTAGDDWLVTPAGRPLLLRAAQLWAGMSERERRHASARIDEDMREAA